MCPTEQVDVLPSDTGVLLVQTDRVLDHLRLTLFRGQHRVEIVDLSEAIATERE